MKDELFWNKIFGAVLATGLLILALRQVSEMYFTTTPPAKPGDAITVQVASTDSSSAAPDTPPDWGTVLPTADVAAGQAQSAKCASCHTFTNGGANGTGPNNWGVIGRAPGSHPGFAYSSAMEAFAKTLKVWDYDHVYMFLANPQGYISGTKMTFVGIKTPQDRINLIAWLRQQSSSPVPIPPANPKAAAAGAAAGAAQPSGPGAAPNTVAAKGDAAAPAATTAGPAGATSGTSSTNNQAGPDAPASTTSSVSNPGGPH